MQLELSKVIDNSERTTRVEYDAAPGFYLQVRYIPRDKLKKVIAKCTRWAFDPSTHTREEKVDTQMFAKEFSKMAIVGWEGLTLEVLRLMIPVDEAALKGSPADTQVEYSEKTAFELLSVAYDLDQFLQSICTNIKYFQSPTHEEELGNS